MGIKQTIMAGGVLVVLVGSWFFRNRLVQASPDNTAPAVTMVEAIETVLAANPGTAAIDVNLEYENNNLAWEVKLNNDLEVYIDANTKEIVKTEQGWNLADVPLLAWLPN
ncbi:PepSY domain-containing protein [Iningainema tapete]|uniref:PepSY domain-containing protein n=1 Tax=Iningainema tapete BLCC-T55 TaxID=2748662 RepID=A0A8J6Y2T9_9CYAN|nr:PepSY domain-containing protein [Iningainema tapete]MBD2778498.1 PepSY domain-containing protein [Iningainema tapete BLCC-T55]